MGGEDKIGFLAHELQEVVPNAVTGVKDEEYEIGTLYDHDGTVLATDIAEPVPSEMIYEEQVGTTDVKIPRRKTWEATSTKPLYQCIDQSKVVPLLSAALKEALTKIETLETKIDNMNNHIVKMQKQIVDHGLTHVHG
tara:strand:- start:343 stop:756 length:414 start_codon:yes stop_codon:yes gene_type:complete